MKLASYNVMSGGFADYDPELPAPERLEALQQAIATIDADVIGLVDTYRWDEIYTEQQIGQLFGYPYARCINLNDDRLRAIGHNNGLTLLSKYPFVSTSTLSLGTRDALRVTLDHESRLDIVVLYLDDLDEDTRLAQVAALVPQLDPTTPTVIMGDFNTFSRADGEADTNRLAALMTKYTNVLQMINKTLFQTLSQMARAEVIDAIQRAGYQDASTLREPTAPTRLFHSWILKPIVRIDYMLHNEGVRVTDFHVPSGDIFNKASDHLPIVGTVTF